MDHVTLKRLASIPTESLVQADAARKAWPERPEDTI
jgi:hypothetical protein